MHLVLAMSAHIYFITYYVGLHENAMVTNCIILIPTINVCYMLCQMLLNITELLIIILNYAKNNWTAS